jgi:hypothetical protein
MLKLLKPSEDIEELEIGRHFSSEAMATNPKNHCVPILDVLLLPGVQDQVFLVMPLLYENELPPFETIGEVIDFFRQIFEVMVWSLRQFTRTEFHVIRVCILCTKIISRIGIQISYYSDRLLIGACAGIVSIITSWLMHHRSTILRLIHLLVT